MTRRLSVAGLALLLALTSLAGVASASPSEEARFVSLINQSRAAAGLAPLTVDPELVSYARKHTAAMIEENKIFHSTTAQLSGVASGWSLLGENVGMGPDPDTLHQAFMNSPSHRANILGDFNYVGVGADRGTDDVLFVTVIFMQKVTTTTTTAPATTTTAPATTTTAPATTTTAPATTTTAPATTTTSVSRPTRSPSPVAAVTGPAGDPPSYQTLAYDLIRQAFVEQAVCSLGSGRLPDPCVD